MATPPDFTAGQVLTAAQMNAVGLWLIKTQTIGTGVSTVTVTDVFSADYDNYLVTISGGTGTGNTTIRMTLGATTANYYTGALRFTYAGSTAQDNVNNGASWVVGTMGVNTIDVWANIQNPNLAKRTMYQSAFALADNSVGFMEYAGGFLDNATQYTAFTIAPGTGNMTGGVIRVFGYRD